MKPNENEESTNSFQSNQIQHSKSNSLTTSSPNLHHHHFLHNRIRNGSFSIPSSSSTVNSTSNLQSIIHQKSSLDRFNLHSNPIQQANLIQQNIIRSRIQSELHSNQAGLEVVMYLKLSIPYNSLSKVNGRSVIIPLMSDHNLRLKNSIVFPLTRKSIHSKPTLQAIPNTKSEAERIASILNLSTSFRINPHHSHQPPIANISVRNFSISLSINLPNLHHPNHESHSNLWNDEHAVAEYAVLLESICLWTTIGPDWPFSVIIPTPTCLRNSFRLMLPSEEDESESSNKIKVITSPTLRRERSTITSAKFNKLSTSKSCPIILDEEPKSLTDESEPDYSGLSEDDEISLRPTHWTQDEHSNRYEGVFQSTKELCVSINHQPTHESLTIDSSITAQRAETNLAISIHRGKNLHSSNLNSLSFSLNLQVTLYNLTLKFDQPMIPFIFHLPDHIANQIISSEWSGITGDSVIESLVPFHDAQPVPSQDITPRNISTKQIPSLSQETILPDLELLHTSAPFEDSGNDPPEHSPWETEDGEVEASFENSFSTPIKTRNLLEQHSSPQINQIPGDVRGRFVVWFDLTTLIRNIEKMATSQDKVLLKFNLHGQIEIRLKNEMNQEKLLDLPLFGFPTVDQHTCIINLSVDPSLSPFGSELDIRLPSSAKRLDLEKESEENHECQIQVNVRKAGPEMRIEETIKLYHSKPISKKEEAVTLLSPINNLVQEETVVTAKPRLKKRYSTSKYKHSHTVSSGSLSTYRKRTPLTEQLLQMKSHDTQVSDQQDGDGTEMKLTIASADIDISFSTSSPCQYLDLSLHILKDGGNGKKDRGIIGLEFLIGLSDRLEVIDGWIGSKRLEVGNGIQISEINHQTENQEKSIDLKLSLHESPSNSIIYNGNWIIRLILKIQRFEKDIKLQSNKTLQAFCVLPSFSESVSLLDIKIRNPNETKLNVIDSSLNRLSSLSNPLLHLRQYRLEPKTKNFLRLEEIQEKVKEGTEEGTIERLSWIERKLERYDFSWKNVLMIWSLYLILSLSFEINQLHFKLDGFESRFDLIHGSFQSHLESFDSLPVKRCESFKSGDRFGEKNGFMDSDMEKEKKCPLIPVENKMKDYEKVKKPTIPLKPSSSSSSPILDNLKEEISKNQRKKNNEKENDEEEEEEDVKSSIGEQFGYFGKLWKSLWFGIKFIFG